MTTHPTPTSATPPAPTRHAEVTTDLGPLTLVADPDGLVGVYFPGHWTRPDPAGFGPAVPLAADALLAEAADQLRAYLAGRRTAFALPLRPRGGARARAVWDLVAAVPYGSTTTYRALAERVGGTSPRAVGGLVGHNPLSVVVPCHRVVGSGGALTGYAGGLDRKRRLLELEGALPATLVGA